MGVTYQNNFSRTMENNIKMGAYYTDPFHCSLINKFLCFPIDEEVSCLEPSIGDASAVKTALKPDINNVKIFGVELNDSVAAEVKEDTMLEEVLNADFLNGVRIKNNAFSLCFSNPPYLDDEIGETKERTVRQFLEKITNYLSKEGLLVWIIPHKDLVDPSTMRFTITHYHIEGAYKFREPEYGKFKQYVLFLRKKDSSPVLKDEVDKAIREVENIEELPDVPDKTFNILPSSSSDITLFCKKEFDTIAAFDALKDMNKEVWSDYNKIISKRLMVERFANNDLNKPPIPLKKDSLYLLATSGAGAGLTGTEESRDLHLQRGVAEVVEDSEVDTTGDTAIEKVVSRTKIQMAIIEQSGKITILK